MLKTRPFVKVDDQRLRVYEGEMREQIAALKERVESGTLPEDRAHSHVRWLIAEREQHLRSVNARARLRRRLTGERRAS